MTSKVSKKIMDMMLTAPGLWVTVKFGYDGPNTLPVTRTGPDQTVDKQDTGKLIAPLCLDEVRSVSHVPSPQESFSSSGPGS